jgi:hypothetical protein
MAVAEQEARFTQRVMAVIEETATPEELADFQALLREHPEFKLQYMEQMRIHGLSCYRALSLRQQRDGDTRSGEGPLLSGVTRTKDVFSRRGVLRKTGGWWKAAAAAVLLLGGIAIWQSVLLPSDLRPPISDLLRSPTSDLRFPVVLVRQTSVRGLDVPSELPGTLRLSSGEVVVRLGSGVELTVLGPASLDIHDVMQVALERGRLLANVPHWATGFVVRTADLEVYDLGTVFSVSVDWPVSDVFVFKGRVRVNEAGRGGFENAAPGEVVGICEAGEGVRAEADERPVKFAADWPAAKKAFASVRDSAAAENPAAACAFAEKIADLWMDGCLSRELSRVEARRSATASAPKIPFRKTAWVRPATSVQQEASNMNKTSAAAVLTAAAVMMGAETSKAFSDPVCVNTSLDQNRRWVAVFTNEVPLRWAWCANAANAKLEIVGMNTVFATNFTGVTSNVLWRAFSANTPSAEDVYDLTLTFYGSGDTVVGALTSRLAVVKGAFGKTAVDPDPNSKTWDKVKENVAVPYDAGWAEATAGAANSRLVIAKVGGAVQTNALADVGGYYGWKLKNSGWGYGTFNLALTFPGMVGEWDAALTRPMDGTMIRMQ